MSSIKFIFFLKWLKTPISTFLTLYMLIDKNLCYKQKKVSKNQKKCQKMQKKPIFGPILTPSKIAEKPSKMAQKMQKNAKFCYF